MKPIIRLHQAVCRMPEWRMATPVDFQLCDGEHLAIVGPNGGGKSMFVDMLTGRHPLLLREPEYDFAPHSSRMVSDNIKSITFRDTYGGDNDRTYFLQQRWNQMEIDKETPTVRQLLERDFTLSGADTPERREMQSRLYHFFGMEHLLDQYIILLSSGELRKVKLAGVLFATPRVLIIDNPFIGLDRETRQQLRNLLTMIVSEQALQIVLVLSKSDEIPEFITHVVEVCDRIVGSKMKRKDFLDCRQPLSAHVLDEQRRNAILSLPQRKDTTLLAGTDEVVRMNKVSIRYGKRTILHNLDWTIRCGERWALSGQNGSGKSTLLSLLCADNPQGYACDIRLFGHQRGTGESIWDIKRHIGYVSPEMHRSYHRDIACLRIVASGMKDSVGLYVRPTEKELQQCHFWMHIFGIEEMENRSFLSISSGEQRLVLLARAFVKDPDLLILDEPLHGLDNINRQRVRDIIDAFCSRPNKTLIMVTHYDEELPGCITHHKKLITTH